MLAAANPEVIKVHTVKTADMDFDLSVKIKRERTAAGPGRGYQVFGMIETIYFEPDDGCKMPLEDAEKVGRRLYWPDHGPAIARSIPEGDLLIVSRLPLRRGYAAMPDVPDPTRPVKNPFKVDRCGQSHLAPDEAPREAPKRRQRLEMIASAKFRNFLVFHPIAQIIVVTAVGAANWASLGSHKMPISSMSSWDDTKMALLVDPYSGECLFKGGRYDISDHFNLDAMASTSLKG
jgi:hypothetical protein